MQIKCFTRFLTLALAPSLLFSINTLAAPYEIIDLGTLGGVENYSFAINELDEVVGNSDGPIIPDDQISESNPANVCQLSDGTSVNREYCSHAYLYSAGILNDLGDLGVFTSFAFNINDNSTVVGYAPEAIDDGDGDPTNDLRHDRAFISFAGGLVEALPYPDEANNLDEGVNPRQRALDISNDRMVVGFTLIKLVNEAAEESSEDRPFVYDYDNATFTLIPLFTDKIDRSGSARAINSAGVVVGWAESEDENNPPHALLWDPLSPEFSVDIGTLGGYTSDAKDINDNGLVVGVSDTDLDFTVNEILSFIYDPSAAIPMIQIPELSDLDDIKSSIAYSINNNNQVVGSSQIKAGFTPRNTAFLYDYNNDNLINLNDMVDCSLNWELVIARDINDSGKITGTGVVDSEVHSFLLIPTGETEPTNCTANRQAEREAEEQKIRGTTSAGSLGGFSLLLFSSILLWRRRR